MASNSKDWMRSITIASPVLLATVISLIFVISSILNPADATAGAINPDQNGSDGDTPSLDTVSVSAFNLYQEYHDHSLDPNANAFHRFTGRQLNVTGVLASWDHSGEPFITMISDTDGNDNIRFVFEYDFTDPEIMDILLNEPNLITVSGISLGYTNGIVILKESSSHDFDINDPTTVG
jgi:hypothetical protein